ncbi:MAG: VCBS repeat-containing protein, partial [Bryobacteraceae bacterium]
LFSGNYLDTFSDLPLDVDGDGRVDVASVAWFSKKITWWRNPGPRGGAWEQQVVEDGHSTEFAFLADLDNDGKAHEILPQFGSGPIAWYGIKDGKWVRHIVAPRVHGHGIGAGDFNGDGRTDIITPLGIITAPADPENGTWKFEPEFSLGSTGFIHVLDVNGDGRKDLLTSLAHDYGILWLEKTEDGQWKKHIIDDSWSQAHAVVLTDLNGDGRIDILTGKRYMAHNGKDPGEREPLGIYWYESRVDEKGQVEWFRHIIDYSTRAGGGMQIAVADIDGDGDTDFAVGGKSGSFLFVNKTK